MGYITVLDTANAAKLIYKNNDCDRLTLTGGFFDPKNNDRLGWEKAGDAGGGSGGLYRFAAGANKFIISFRGSKGDKDWLTDDRQIALNWTVDRASDCITYAKQVKSSYPGADIVVVGHSLGGFLAQMVGAMCDLPFVTYNAPPAGRQVSAAKARGINIRVSWDPVSRAIGRHVGPLISLPHYGYNILDAHTSAAYIKSVKKSKYCDLPVHAVITAANRGKGPWL